MTPSIIANRFFRFDSRRHMPIYVALPQIPIRALLRNPFKDASLRQQYDAAVAAFDDRNPDLIRFDPTFQPFAHRGNAWATHFWWGWCGPDAPGRSMDAYGREHRTSSGYVFFRAGVDIRRALSKRPDIELKPNLETSNA